MRDSRYVARSLLSSVGIVVLVQLLLVYFAAYVGLPGQSMKVATPLHAKETRNIEAIAEKDKQIEQARKRAEENKRIAGSDAGTVVVSDEMSAETKPGLAENREDPKVQRGQEDTTFVSADMLEDPSLSPVGDHGMTEGVGQDDSRTVKRSSVDAANSESTVESQAPNEEGNVVSEEAAPKVVRVSGQPVSEASESSEVNDEEPEAEKKQRRWLQFEVGKTVESEKKSPEVIRKKR